MRLFLAFVLALLSMSSTTALARPVEGVPCARASATYARGELQGHNGGLLYAQQRWLDPSTGRFLSLDPVAGSLDEPLSTQGYTYGRSNPLRFTDPDGRFDNPVADSLGYLERQLRMISEVSVDFLTSTTKGAAVGLAGLACTASVGCATVVGIIGTVGLMTSGAPTAVAMEDQGLVAWKCMHGTATYEELLQCGEMEGGAPAAMVGGAAAAESRLIGTPHGPVGAADDAVGLLVAEGRAAAPDPMDVFVYRAQPVRNITTGGAFLRSREAGKPLMEAFSIRKRLLEKVLSTDNKIAVKAMQDAQASGLKSPLISTTFDEDAARATFESLKARGIDAELLTIQGPRSGGLDFEAEFAARGGRLSAAREKDAAMREFGIFDLFVPRKGQSKSGFRVIKSEK